jgi:hypothetical protein
MMIASTRSLPSHFGHWSTSTSSDLRRSPSRCAASRRRARHRAVGPNGPRRGCSARAQRRAVRASPWRRCRWLDPDGPQRPPAAVGLPSAASPASGPGCLLSSLALREAWSSQRSPSSALPTASPHHDRRHGRYHHMQVVGHAAWARRPCATSCAARAPLRSGRAGSVVAG